MQEVTSLDWATFSVAMVSLGVFAVVMVFQVMIFRLQKRIARASRGLIKIVDHSDRLVSKQVELKVTASNVGREIAFDVRANVESVVHFEITPTASSPTWAPPRGDSLGPSPNPPMDRDGRREDSGRG